MMNPFPSALSAPGGSHALAHLQGPVGRSIEGSDERALLAQLGSEVAAVLSSALERVTALGSTGRIDRFGLHALRDEIDRARRAGMMAQQLQRLAGGQVKVVSERLDLTALLREVLRQRGREIDARGIEVRQVLCAAAVASDASLLFLLLQTVLDWSFDHAVSRIDFQLEMLNWPPHARLSVRFAHQPEDEVGFDSATLAQEGDEVPALNTIAWRLLQQTAAVLGLPVQRIDNGAHSELRLAFPQTLLARVAVADDSAIVAHDTQALAGRHVIVLSARRELRSVVLQALRPMGVMLDFASSVEEAQALGADGLPHALVFEALLGGERLERLRGAWLVECPALACIQIAEQGKAFEVLNVGGRQCASVGRDALIEALPAALLFELSRQGQP
jgi:hypothetical protein